MKHFQWDSKIGPASVLAVFQIVALFVVVVGYIFSQQADIKLANVAIAKLEAITQAQTAANVIMLERFVKVETKVDVMTDTVGRIEARQISAKR